MDHRAIEIDEMEDRAIEMATHSSSNVHSMEEKDFQQMILSIPNGEGPSRMYGEEPVPIPENRLDTAVAEPFGEAVNYSLRRIQRRLEERRANVTERGRSQHCSIFRLPQTLCGINKKAEQPEVVSIGPYHRGQDHLLDFEHHKWFFLDRFLYRTRSSVKFYLEQMAVMEAKTRDCYSEPVLISSGDFIEMMLLDGCFVIELLRHLGQREGDPDDHDPIFSQPWLIPILLRDLLKLENQLPFFVIEMLFVGSRNDDESKGNYLSILALNVFDLAFPRPKRVLDRLHNLRGEHLLQLFHSSFVPSGGLDRDNYMETYRPSYQSIQPATQLRPSGIKFKSLKADSFLDINFRYRVLEIPSVTINDFTSTLLINCIGFEQCQEDGPKYLTDYASFMNCLINQPRDAALLCLDGIITRFSQDDQYVANLFNELGKNMVFNVHDCYLSKQFKDVESYYGSNWATMMRTYFCSPWSFISVCSAFVIILLTAIQAVFAVLSFIWH